MKNTNFLTSKIIAHRGYHDISLNIPENSLAAFNRAIRFGYPIELDVHLLKDGNVAVFHDYDLKRVCGVNRLIETCDVSEIKKYHLFNTKEQIPLLKDVLLLVAGKVPLLIEIKAGLTVGNLEKTVAKLLDEYEGNFAIQSFSIKSLWWFKKRRSNYVRGLISGIFLDKKASNLSSWIEKTIVSGLLLRTDFIAYDVNALPSKYISNLRKQKPVIGWTVRNKKTYNKAVKYCDGLIGENMSSYV